MWSFKLNISIHEVILQMEAPSFFRKHCKAWQTCYCYNDIADRNKKLCNWTALDSLFNRLSSYDVEWLLVAHQIKTLNWHIAEIREQYGQLKSSVQTCDQFPGRITSLWLTWTPPTCACFKTSTARRGRMSSSEFQGFGSSPPFSERALQREW